jgi:hypothetical protein
MSASAKITPPALHEFRDLLPHLPSLSPEPGTAAWQWGAGKLPGDLANAQSRVAIAQQRFPIKIDHPRLAILTSGANAAWVNNLTSGQALLPYLCQTVDADLRLYEMPGQGVLDETQTAQAIAYGMMAVETGVDFIAAYLDDDLGGEIISATDPLLALQTANSRPLAALLGLVLAARMGKVPVVLLGDAAINAAKLWQNAYPSMMEHVLPLPGQVSDFAPLVQQFRAIAAWQRA